MFCRQSNKIVKLCIRQKADKMNVIAHSFDNTNHNETELASDLDAHLHEMSPRVRKLKFYWEAQKNENGKMPCICDIELMDIYDISSNIAMDDVGGKKESFKNRFWGGELTWRFAFEGTAKPVTSFQPPCFSAKLINRYEEILCTRQPYWQKSMQVRGRYDSHAPVEVLHLPLSGKDKPHVQHILSIFDFASHAAPR